FSLLTFAPHSSLLLLALHFRSSLFTPLPLHSLRMEQGPKFICPYCQRKGFLSNKARHLRSCPRKRQRVRSQEPFICPHCQKEKPRHNKERHIQSCLRKRQRVQSQEPFICPHCQKEKSRHNKERHIKSCQLKSQHGQSRVQSQEPFTCPRCRKEMSLCNKAQHLESRSCQLPLHITALPTPEDHPRDTLLKCLEECIPDLDQEVKEVLYQTPWSTLDCIAEETRQIWESASISIPTNVPSDSCWNGTRPPTEKLFSLILKGMFDITA
ncbi:hypothetical protein CLAIMM_14597, partial [Cladophialophora immunda]